mmetsp:Transcript_24214/g.52914  ORF Transcript_24214/g.52914 Transcript_24214/m.52914 type:complete len:226 (-) Transcript_24214:1035-1712(-)|eukprot:CAMPEP_0202891038 /NCGR_PEP_ID=MMETSP1392-20130828/1233_1 /ASSEMBLY_ACC=CAM_ASM_000868 /TAXON_ID=225041 /ORGANISM="Chlamydomonas chlamydogama, Strain SAG 11-48b" /LENGTH=225 /DNA_ID=CAMNT_0049574703 /DNA_START=106 /DNA_END=783 /DNA_ORIENTATION=+
MSGSNAFASGSGPEADEVVDIATRTLRIPRGFQGWPEEYDSCPWDPTNPYFNQIVHQTCPGWDFGAVTEITIILPETEAPFNRFSATGEEAKNISGLGAFLRQLLSMTMSLKKFTLVKMWPINLYDIWEPWEELEDFPEFKLCPQLETLDMGFMGYGGMDEDALRFLAGPVLQHVREILFEDRCGAYQWWEHNQDLLHYAEKIHNCYWEGSPASAWLQYSYEYAD